MPNCAGESGHELLVTRVPSQAHIIFSQAILLKSTLIWALQKLCKLYLK